MPATALTDLQQRIAAALQVSPRAPWNRIASVLGVPDRTVTRNGTELLASGRVAIAALARPEHQVILACESVPGTAQLVSEAIARRDDSIFSYQTTGEYDVVAELGHHVSLRELLGLQVPAITGLRRLAAFPILKYFKTIRAWQCGALTQAETQALSAGTGPVRIPPPVTDPPGPNDAALIETLQSDGRRSVESIARQLKMSETSVNRRIDWLVNSGQLSIRAIVEPADVGFPVEAVLWVQASPHHVDALGREIHQWPEVRYAAAIAGTHQLIVNITARSHSELYQRLAHPIWGGNAIHVQTDVIYEVRKRGGRIRPVQ